MKTFVILILVCSCSSCTLHDDESSVSHRLFSNACETLFFHGLFVNETSLESFWDVTFRDGSRQSVPMEECAMCGNKSTLRTCVQDILKKLSLIEGDRRFTRERNESIRFVDCFTGSERAFILSMISLVFLTFVALVAFVVRFRLPKVTTDLLHSPSPSSSSSLGQYAGEVTPSRSGDEGQ